jgi:predicted NAD/FAD-dependent oxidoreductase
MATRRTRIPRPEGVELTVEFDHGAPDFDLSERSLAFSSWLKQAHAAGVVAPWAFGSKGHEAQASSSWVATPDMPALCRWLLDGQTVQTLCTIDGLRRSPGGWTLTSSDQIVEAGFDAVVITIPPAQAAALLRPHRADWAELSQAQVMNPCWTLMAVTDAAEMAELTPPDSSPLAMIIRQDTKPGRAALPGMASWVAHAHTDWTKAHLQATPEAVLPILQTALQEIVGRDARWHYGAVHRWRYAQHEGPANTMAFLWDPGLGLGMCGDAWGNGGVAGAWDSATGLCNVMLNP